MKVYRGYRKMEASPFGDGLCEAGCSVTVEGDGETRPLDLRLDVENKSPTGFEWGYSGSGPAQLALALVADCVGEAWAIPPIYQRVKETLVARLPKDGWVLTEDAVRMACVDAGLAAGMGLPDQR